MPPVVQRGFLKGLDASTDKFTQPRGSVPAISNLIFSKRGSLKTVDGTSLLPGNPTPPVNAIFGSSLGPGPILCAYEYSGPNLTTVDTDKSIYFLQEVATAPGDPFQLGDAVNFVGTGVTTGTGLLNPGTSYDYVLTTIAQGQSHGATLTMAPGGANDAIDLSWSVLPGAVGYAIYRKETAGFFWTLVAVVLQPDYAQSGGILSGVWSGTYRDDGNSALASLDPPASNTTTGYTALMRIPFSSVTLNYSAAQLIAKLPIVGGVGISPNGGLNTPRIVGSSPMMGATALVPKIVQFDNKLIVLLGSGIRPFELTMDTLVLQSFSNTFTATYAQWQANVTYLVDDIVVPAISNGHYYKCIQGGMSDAAAPAFPVTTDATINDKQIVWQEAGLVTAVNPPPGGARGIYHAGSFWVFNTSPTNTADLLDGPSALRACDVNNVRSWNPLNSAFIGKDDGQEGQGLASFTIAEAGIPPIGSLIAFKEYSAYQIVGFFGSPNFTIQQLPTDMGCIAPASIKFIPSYGIIRFTHVGFAIYNGIRDVLISEPIRPYIFGSPTIPALIPQGLGMIAGEIISDPPMYIVAGATTAATDSLDRVFMYDLILKAWSIIDLPVTTNPKSYFRCLALLHNNRMANATAPPPYTIIGGSENNSIQVIQKGAATWGMYTNTIAVSWAFTTPEVFNSEDPSAELKYDSLIIRGVNTDGNPISVSVNLQTEAGYATDPRTYNVGAGEFEIYVGINESALGANALISGTGRVEISSVSWNIKPTKAGIPMVIS